ncbi:MAG: ATP-binding cassette domain-containing protein, partial [Lactobacillus delbrueckii]|nr:ATP-binding cassette domain-containing protein [Lactobacillus delbrueckii]
MIEYRDVGMTYGDNVILKQINLTINDGELFVLVGPSGSGKTTLLRMINRLTEPTHGDVYLDGKRVKDHD